MGQQRRQRRWRGLGWRRGGPRLAVVPTGAIALVAGGGGDGDFGRYVAGAGVVAGGGDGGVDGAQPRRRRGCGPWSAAATGTAASVGGRERDRGLCRRRLRGPQRRSVASPADAGASVGGGGGGGARWRCRRWWQRPPSAAVAAEAASFVGGSWGGGSGNDERRRQYRCWSRAGAAVGHGQDRSNMCASSCPGMPTGIGLQTSFFRFGKRWWIASENM